MTEWALLSNGPGPRRLLPTQSVSGHDAWRFYCYRSSGRWRWAPGPWRINWSSVSLLPAWHKRTCIRPFDEPSWKPCSVLL